MTEYTWRRSVKLEVLVVFVACGVFYIGMDASHRFIKASNKWKQNAITLNINANHSGYISEPVVIR